MKARTKIRALTAPQPTPHTLITYALLLALALSMLLVAYAPAFAQATNGTLTDIGTGEARVLTSNLTTLTPGQQITYQFAYDGDDQPIAVTMNAIPADAAIFEIWTDERLEQLGEDSDTEPLGRGTAMQEGAGVTNWQGGSPEAETYYVVVTATGNSPVSFVLNISSPALSGEQPSAVVATPVAPSDPNIATVTTDALNVRSGPSTAFPVLITVPIGTEMTVLGRNAINTWINVELEDGTVGWVTRSLTNYITINPNIISPAGTIGATVGATATVTNTTAITTGTGTTPITPTGTISATDLGSDWQILESDAVAWYSFQYRGGDSPLTVWMDLEPFAAAEFIVVDAATAESIMAGTAITPTNVIGRGRANPVEPGYLYWQADFAEADTYYVLIQPTEDAVSDILYTITALGPGVGRVIETEE